MFVVGNILIMWSHHLFLSHSLSLCLELEGVGDLGVNDRAAQTYMQNCLAPELDFTDVVCTCARERWKEYGIDANALSLVCCWRVSDCITWFDFNSFIRIYCVSVSVSSEPSYRCFVGVFRIYVFCFNIGRVLELVNCVSVCDYCSIELIPSTERQFCIQDSVEKIVHLLHSRRFFLFVFKIPYLRGCLYRELW